jgi:DNA-binding response OmpR family regulator
MPWRRPGAQSLAMETPTILLLDQDPDGAALIEHALRAVPGQNRVIRFGTVDDAAAWLATMAVRQDRVALALLDPHGGDDAAFAPIGTLRAIPGHHFLPVVVLDCNGDPNAMVRAYSWGANSVVRKPFDPVEFRTVLLQVAAYWIFTNTRATEHEA